MSELDPESESGTGRPKPGRRSPVFPGRHRRLRGRGSLPVLTALAGAGLGLALPERASATGFFVNQQSVPGLGRAFAGSPAAADDPSTVFYNPAGMTRLFDDPDEGFGFVGSAGAHVIIPRSTLDDSGSTAATPGTLGVPSTYPGRDAEDPGDPTPIGNLYAVQRLYEGRLALGLGVTSPFGLSGEFDDDWFGRYDSIETELTTINVGPALAIRLNDVVSIGVGFDAQYADSTLSSAIPDPLAPGGPSPASDGLFRAEGDDWSFGYNLGLLVTVPNSGLRLGVHFRSEMDHTIEGSARTSGLTGPLAAFNGKVGASAESDLPAILSAGLAYVAMADDEVGDRLTLYGDFSYFWWGEAKEGRIEFDDGRPDVVRVTDFRDTYAIGIGADYRWSEQLTLRSGFRLDRTPTVDGFRDTTFADANRYWIGAGASYRVADWLTADLGFVHVFEESTTVDVERRFFEGTPLASAIRVRADVESSVSTVAASARLSF